MRKHKRARKPKAASSAPPVEPTAKPVTSRPPNGRTPDAGTHAGPPHRAKPHRFILPLIVAIASALLDAAIGVTPLGSAIKTGSYSDSMAGGTPSAPVVTVDLSYFVKEPLKAPPLTAQDPDWARVIQNWKNIDALAAGLAKHGAKAVLLDYELALPDYYLDKQSTPPQVDKDAMGPDALETYRKTWADLDATMKAGTPVVVGADQVAARPNRQWLAQEQRGVGVSLIAPPASLGGFIATAYVDAVPGGDLPAATKTFAGIFGDKLADAMPAPGLSARAEEAEEGGPHQFWVDYGLVDPKPLPIHDISDLDSPDVAALVQGKTVVVGDVERSERSDQLVVPREQTRTGCFFHASALATRLYSPIFAPAGPLVEAAYLFLASLAFSLLAVAGSALAVKAFGVKEGSATAEWIEVGFDAAALVIALLGVMWLSTHLAQHRLLLPTLVITMLGRVFELSSLALNPVKQALKGEHHKD